MTTNLPIFSDEQFEEFTEELFEYWALHEDIEASFQIAVALLKDSTSLENEMILEGAISLTNFILSEVNSNIFIESCTQDSSTKLVKLNISITMENYGLFN